MLTIGQITYANCTPIFHELLKDVPADRYRMVRGVPAALNEMLRQGGNIAAHLIGLQVYVWPDAGIGLAVLLLGGAYCRANRDKAHPKCGHAVDRRRHPGAIAALQDCQVVRDRVDLFPGEWQIAAPHISLPSRRDLPIYLPGLASVGGAFHNL